MKKIISLTLIAMLSLPALAQRNIDSLLNVLENKNPPVKEQLVLYDKIAEHYSQIDAAKSLSYGKRGLILAEKEKDKRMIARLCIDIGAAYLMTSSTDSCIIFLERAVALSEEVEDKETEAWANSIIAIWYLSEGEKEEALKYNLKSLALYEAIGNKGNVARLMINIGSSYAEMNQNEQALSYFRRAQATIESMELKYAYLETAVYESLGGYYFRTGDYKQALENVLIALDLSRKNNLIKYEIVTTQYLAGIYTTGFKDYTNAEKYALECVKAAESTESKEYKTVAWNMLTKVYIDAGKYKEGKEIALKLWNMDSTSTFHATNTAQSLAKCYLYTGEKDKAMYFFNKQDVLRVQGAEENFLNSLSDMEVKYETEKKEMRITTLEEEQKLYIGLGIAALVALLSIIGLLIYRQRLATQKQKLAEQQIKQLEQEKELIAVRSALEAEKTEREIIARDLHDGVGAILSVVKNNLDMLPSGSKTENKEGAYLHKALENLNKSMIELRRVAHHIMPDILIEKGLTIALEDFCQSIPAAEFHFTGIDRRLDQEKELVLYRCAYELVNNAMRHAKASRIDVHLNMDMEKVYLSVVDNGDGFDMQTVSMGMGINNMRTRLSIFGGSIDIFSTPEKGTEVNIELSIANSRL